MPPVPRSSSISDWTEEDLLQFLRTHMSHVPGGITTEGLVATNLDVRGPINLGSHPINSTGMVSPILVSGASGPGYQNGATDSPLGGVGKPQYYIDAFGCVHLRGVARIAGVNATSTVFVLPPRFRPDTDIVVGVSCYDHNANSWYGVRALQIGSNGAVALQNIATADDVDIYFDGTKYPVKSNN